MSVVRSPPTSSITSDEGNRNSMAMASGFDKPGGSQPDLRKFGEYLLDSESQRQVTFRSKRKVPDDDLSAKFEIFQENIKTMLTDMTKTQAEHLNRISQDVSSIKEEISIIKATTSNLSIEHNKLKLQIADILDFKNNIDSKIATLEHKIESLKITNDDHPQRHKSFCYEDFIRETQERQHREKNLIIRGIKEIHSTDLEVRRRHDFEEVKNIIKMANSDSVDPIKTIRLGNYKPDSHRPIKVIFEANETPKAILRNKKNIKPESIKIYSDETPQQKHYREKLQEELRRRQNNGEADITIKYIRGIPKITKIQPKN